MVFVRIIRDDGNKLTCEELNLYHGCCRGKGIDRVVVSNDWSNSDKGYRVTQEDFESLFLRKHNEAMKQIEARKSAQQKETEKQLEEMKRWKAEMEGKGFIRQVAALWKWRRRAGE